MKTEIYELIVTIIREHRGLSKDCSNILSEKFADISKDTLFSIMCNEYQKRMKVNFVKAQTEKFKYYELYLNGISEIENPGIILRIAEKFDLAPCLVAKLILEKHFENIDSDKEQVNVNTYLRDTSLIPDMDLAYEVFLCTIYDDLYSPVVENMRYSLGQQYEIKLYKEITDLGLAFRSEDDLRRYSYDKTPDVKLEVPVAVDGFVINWIESKALFADKELHIEYTKNQYLSYWNRFGPGLVIYWFDFLETIVEPNDKRFIIRNHLPKNIHIISTFLYPLHGNNNE